MPVGRFRGGTEGGVATDGIVTRPNTESDAGTDLAPPPAVLLRCTQRAPSETASGAPVRMDVFRDKLALGWDENYPEFIKAVIDVDSHHYGILELNQVGFI